LALGQETKTTEGLEGSLGAFRCSEGRSRKVTAPKKPEIIYEHETGIQKECHYG
jgi:hypothetical protein